jgi:hypothetical protein
MRIYANATLGFGVYDDSGELYEAAIKVTDGLFRKHGLTYGNERGYFMIYAMCFEAEASISNADVVKVEIEKLTPEVYADCEARLTAFFEEANIDWLSKPELFLVSVIDS